jgi:hypothetical protein
MQSGAETHLRRLQIHMPVCFSSAKMRRKSCGYFARDLGLGRFGRFFLRCSRILGGSGTADLFIHLDEGSLQLTITAEGLDPPLGLGLLGRRGEALADSLAFHLVSQPGMRTMTRSENLTARKSASGLRPAFVPDRQTGDASCQPSVSHTLTNRRPKKETYRFPTFLSPISRA